MDARALECARALAAPKLHTFAGTSGRKRMNVLKVARPCSATLASPGYDLIECTSRSKPPSATNACARRHVAHAWPTSANMHLANRMPAWARLAAWLRLAQSADEAEWGHVRRPSIL